jgi:uncharacterized protein YrrD
VSEDSGRDESGAGQPEVAWKAIQGGAQVFSSEGIDVGTVSRVVGDAEADVFTGLAIKLRALGHEHFVPSEQVRAIWPDRIDVSLTEQQVKQLPQHQEAPAMQVRPANRGFFARLFGR